MFFVFLALRCVYVSRHCVPHHLAAELPAPGGYAWYFRHGIMARNFIAVDNAEAWVGLTPFGDIVLTCRGTTPTSMADIWSDIRLIPVSVPDRDGDWKRDGDGYVHAGFQAYAEKLLPGIVEWCEKNAHPAIGGRAAGSATDIYLAGHSLGAAAAFIVAHALENKHRFRNVRLVTLGCPAVATPAFCAQINTPHWRVVNKRDAIPRANPVPRITHHGELLYIDRFGRIEKRTSDSLVSVLSSSAGLVGRLASSCARRRRRAAG